MKNRIPLIFISMVFLFAVIGLVSSVVNNPIGLLQNIVFTVGVVFLIWLLVRRFYKASPDKKEQKAFIKAAKKSKKRLQLKEKSPIKQTVMNKSTSFKAKKQKRNTNNTHLTVIEGKKNKKKKRVSF